LFERLGLTPADSEDAEEEMNRDMALLNELKRSAQNELFFSAMD
jgi:hypothetical protein